MAFTVNVMAAALYVVVSLSDHTILLVDIRVLGGACPVAGCSSATRWARRWSKCIRLTLPRWPVDLAPIVRSETWQIMLTLNVLTDAPSPVLGLLQWRSHHRHVPLVT